MAIGNRRKAYLRTIDSLRIKKVLQTTHGEFWFRTRTHNYVTEHRCHSADLVRFGFREIQLGVRNYRASSGSKFYNAVQLLIGYQSPFRFLLERGVLPNSGAALNVFQHVASH